MAVPILADEREEYDPSFLNPASETRVAVEALEIVDLASSLSVSMLIDAEVEKDDMEDLGELKLLAVPMPESTVPEATEVVSSSPVTPPASSIFFQRKCSGIIIIIVFKGSNKFVNVIWTTDAVRITFDKK